MRYKASSEDMFMGLQERLITKRHQADCGGYYVKPLQPVETHAVELAGGGIYWNLLDLTLIHTHTLNPIIVNYLIFSNTFNSFTYMGI